MLAYESYVQTKQTDIHNRPIALPATGMTFKTLMAITIADTSRIRDYECHFLLVALWPVVTTSLCSTVSETLPLFRMRSIEW